MIEHSENAAHQTDVILAKANFSLTLHQLLQVILGLALLTLAIAAFLALQGYWPVLVIALLQVLIVALTLYTAWRNSWSSPSVGTSTGRRCGADATRSCAWARTASRQRRRLSE